MLPAHTQVLRAEITPPAAPGRDTQVDGGPQIRPAHLPGDLPAFVGREPVLEEMSRFLGGNETGTVRIAAVSGMGGIGKTTLVVRCAHQLATKFPDGQMYVDMRGFDPAGEPVDPYAALGGLLGALGVDERRLPVALADRIGLYRSIIAGRRMMVVIDNVRDSEHARPLLPGTPGNVALVTSRNPLYGLIAREGARPSILGPLSSAEAQTMLERRLGVHRTTGDRPTLAHVIEACGGLPLALALFAARAAIHPKVPLSLLNRELNTSRRLDGFQAEIDRDIRAVFSWSYRMLGASAASLFRLLALHPGPCVGVVAAARVLGEQTGLVGGFLREITGAGLLTEQAPGRFWRHELVRAYSAELMQENDPPHQQLAARGRLLDHHLHGARPVCPAHVTPGARALPALGRMPAVVTLDGVGGAPTVETRRGSAQRRRSKVVTVSSGG